MDFEKYVPTPQTKKNVKRRRKNNKKKNWRKILYNKRLILVRTRKINEVFLFYEGRLHLNEIN